MTYAEKRAIRVKIVNEFVDFVLSNLNAVFFRLSYLDKYDIYSYRVECSSNINTGDMIFSITDFDVDNRDDLFLFIDTWLTFIRGVKY